jgi:hypothetical protein
MIASACRSRSNGCSRCGHGWRRRKRRRGRAEVHEVHIAKRAILRDFGKHFLWLRGKSEVHTFSRVCAPLIRGCGILRGNDKEKEQREGNAKPACRKACGMSAFGCSGGVREWREMGGLLKVSLLRMMLGFSASDADPGLPAFLVYRICGIRKICLVEKTQRDRDQIWPRIDHVRHRRSAARAKPVSDHASTVSSPNKFEPAPLNSDSVDRKANLCRKSAPRPLLAGPAVTDRKSEGLA